MAGGSGAEPDANAKFGREPGEHQWFDGGSQMLGGGFRHVSNMFLLGEAFQPLQLARAQHRMLIHSPPKKWEDDISPKCHDDPASHLVYWRMAQAQHLEGWQRAAHILKTLRHGPQADAITFNTALDGYAAATCWGDAVNLAEEMSRHQVNGDDLMDLTYNILLMSIKGLGWQFGLHRKSSGHSFWFIYNHLFWVLATSPFLLTNLLQSLKTTPSLCNPSSCLA